MNPLARRLSAPSKRRAKNNPSVPLRQTAPHGGQQFRHGLMILGLALIIGGVLTVELGSQAAQRKREASI